MFSGTFSASLLLPVSISINSKTNSAVTIWKPFSLTAIVEIKEQRNTKYASEKCKNAGFYLTSGVLPESLNTVNYRRVNKAVCGACDTLGAAVIGFILLADDRELKDISSRHPEMIIDIDKLLKQRGHKDVREYFSEEVSTFEDIYTYIIKEILNFIE